MDEGKKDLGVATGKPSLGEYLFGEAAKKDWEKITDDSRDEKLGNVLIKTWENVNKKYGLPDYDLSENGRQRLLDYAERNNIPIKYEEPNSFGHFYIGGQEVGSDICYYEGDNSIHCVKGKELDARKLRHELAHAVQQQKYPGMQIEHRELESNMLEVGNSSALNLEIVQEMIISQVARASAIYYGLKGEPIPWKIEMS